MDFVNYQNRERPRQAWVQSIAEIERKMATQLRKSELKRVKTKLTYLKAFNKSAIFTITQVHNLRCVICWKLCLIESHFILTQNPRSRLPPFTVFSLSF